jgi:hypothetical protein
MRVLERTRTARLLLALACCVALLAPVGAAVRAAAGRPAAAAAADELARTPAGLERDLLRDRVGLLVAPGGKRDDREPAGPTPLGVLAAALAATAGAWSAAARRGDRPARRRAAAAAGARAPPSLQLASI